MPTLKDYREDYYTFSGLASTNARSLLFAAIAIIWIFKLDVQPGSTYALPSPLYCAGIAVVVGLACDLLQYVSATIVWGSFWRAQEKRGIADDTELDAPPWFNWPSLGFFWGKLVSVAVAYGLLLAFLLEHVRRST